MKIDVFTHFLPIKYVETVRERAPEAFRRMGKVMQLSALVDVEARLRVTEPFPNYRQVLTSAGVPESGMPPQAVPELIRLLNDEMAALVAKRPDQFIAFVASVSLTNVDAGLKELERAVGGLGARGLQLFTNVDGVPLDDPRFAPFFARMAEYDLPIWLHPTRRDNFPDYLSEDRSRYNISHIFGWPYETTAALTRIVFAGYLKRFPNLKIIAHHAGGLLPHFAGRVADTYDTDNVLMGELRQKLDELGRHPAEYFHMIYGDTALAGTGHAIPCALGYFGSEKLLFATDIPYGREMGARRVRETTEAIDALPISAEEREAIYWRNAARLMKLKLE